MNTVVGYLKSWLSQTQRWPSNVVRIIHWLPYIWKDRDWDYAHLLILMRYKLSRMEKLIREKGHHLYHERDADSIRFAILLLNRIIADEYGLKEHEELEAKWGKYVRGPHTEFDNCIVMRREHVTPENKDEYEADLTRVCNHGMYMAEQDWALLWKYLEKNVRKWWD